MGNSSDSSLVETRITYHDQMIWVRIHTGDIPSGYHRPQDSWYRLARLLEYARWRSGYEIVRLEYLGGPLRPIVRMVHGAEAVINWNAEPTEEEIIEWTMANLSR